MKKKRRLQVFIIFFCAILCLSVLYFKKHTTEDKCETLAVISSKKTGDSKLWKDKIISSTSGHLILFDFNGSIVREYLDLEADWIYPLENSDFIIGGNFNNEVFSFSLDSDGNVLEYHNILTSDNVMIDPTVVQMDDTYLFTCTEIEGVVNNSNLNIENGTYTIHTYTSKDLKNWIYQSDIITCKKNLEDGDMLYQNGILYYIFEKEICDKGPSSINVISSMDKGLSWGQEKEILAADADYEPGICLPTKSGYVLYYSSDKKNPEKSYNGSSIYTIELDKNFNIISSEIEIDLNDHQGMSLYDVAIENDRYYFLYCQDYLTDNNLILKAIFNDSK